VVDDCPNLRPLGLNWQRHLLYPVIHLDIEYVPDALTDRRHRVLSPTEQVDVPRDSAILARQEERHQPALEDKLVYMLRVGPAALDDLLETLEPWATRLLNEAGSD
jgi:hypothetical protein